MDKWKVLSGSGLKLIALLAMAVDHSGGWLLKDYPWALEPMFVVAKTPITWFFICRGVIGRLAFPIFAFLLVEGYRHTHSRMAYLYSLLVWAMLTQPCCNLMHEMPWYTYWNGLNVLFTLAAGLLAMMVYDSEHFSTVRKTCYLLLLMVGVYLCRTDYGAMGVSFVLLLHVLRDKPGLTLAATIGCFVRKWPFVGLSWVLMMMYNGKRGFIRGTFAKYLFYAFYPLHMLVIWAIRNYG